MTYADPERQREFNRRWQQERRQAWLATNGPCIRCGSWDDLQIDHKDPAQKVTHRVWSWRENRRAAELQKCQVLCKSCHRLKTREDRRPPVVHGTRSTYDFYRCRCRPCTDAAVKVALDNRRKRGRR